jgi:putative ABC transport system permease protein
MRQPGGKPPLMPPTEDELEANPGLAEGWRFYNARLVDDEFLKSNQFQLMVRAKGYNSDREVWDALAEDPTLAVIDSLPVFVGQQGGGGGGFGGTPLFYVSGVDTGNPVMEPVEIEARLPGMPDAPPVKVKIVGVLDSLANYTGLYVSNELAQQISPAPIPATTYFFRAGPGEDVQELRRALGSAFLENGLEPVVIEDQLRQQQAVGNTLNGLLQGFMALGLVVGMAALGVISTRAVVERRQQIGVLRAIGYQKGMVATSFMLESSFIALLGILIGVALGILLSYNMVQFFQEDTAEIQFSVPWLQLAGIVAVAYVVSLFTTVLPARSAAQIYPAEALRYE